MGENIGKNPLSRDQIRSALVEINGKKVGSALGELILNPDLKLRFQANLYLPDKLGDAASFQPLTATTGGNCLARNLMGTRSEERNTPQLSDARRD